MPDYPPENNEERVERQQQLGYDAGASRREIQDAVRDFTRRAVDRIEARGLPPIASGVPSPAEPIREIKVETVTLPINPLTLAAPAVQQTDPPAVPAGTEFPTADDGTYLIVFTSGVITFQRVDTGTIPFCDEDKDVIVPYVAP